LKGDFCFVLWDDDRQELFCGRDQLGVRALFYAALGTKVFVSDSIEFIVANATMALDLDGYWIADFLTSGFCVDFDRTVYKHIKRLPPGHYLTVTATGCKVHRYWELVIESPIYYKQPRQYIEHFQDASKLAIMDRLPAGRVGISMSGGIDSSTLAAQTLEVRGNPSEVIAHTVHFEHLVPDEEKHFSSLVAGRLGIPQVLRAVDDSCYDPDWHTQELRTPEPSSWIVQAAPERILSAEMASHARVWFYGEGPDNALLFEWQAYLRWLLKKVDLQHAAAAAFQYLATKRPREWRSTLQNLIGHHSTGRTSPLIELPPWLNKQFVREMDLTARARAAEHCHSQMHPWHPRAVANLSSSLWPSFLEQFDSAIWGAPLTWRHPYLDLRVLTFLLSVPPIPWARRKRLLREAMRGVLPDEVLRRDKAPLASDPQAIMLRKHGLPPLPQTGSISTYVDVSKVPAKLPAQPLMHPLLNVFVLDYWLRSRRWSCISDMRPRRAVLEGNVVER
jgi:asparagine synthase (glutamine-hydrolysing)